MSDSTYIGQRVQNLEVAPEFDTITRVIIHAGQTTDAQGNTQDLDYIAGNTTGRTIEVEDPFGTQAKANALLSRLQNSEWQYQPYQADKALLDPAAELGDAVTISDTYSALYRRDITFSSLMAADLAAPSDEEIEHEFPYIPKEDRVYKRETEFTRSQLKLNQNAITAEVTARQTAVNGAITTMRGELNVKASEINATVSAETNRATAAEGTKLNHTNTAQAFGWSLTSTAFLLKNNNAEVFRFDKDGLRFKSNGSDVFTVTRTGGLYVKGNGEFTGKITASSGTIGGWNIGDKFLSYGTWGSANGLLLCPAGSTTSKAIGGSSSISGWTITSGANFGVTKSGELYAKSGKIGGFVIGASAIYNGKTSFAVAGNGVYIGTNGIALGDGTNQHSFTVYKDGALTLRRGMTSLGDTTNNGVYFGTDGIAFGAGKFKVTSSGDVTATNLTIKGGSIKIGGTEQNPNFYVSSTGNLTANNGSFGGTVKAKKILYDGDNGTLSGNAITNSSITGGKIGSGQITGGSYGHLASGTVAYGNVGFTGTLDQVGINQSDIAAIYGYFTGSANFSWLNADHFALDGHIHYNASVPVEGSYLHLVTWG